MARKSKPWAVILSTPGQPIRTEHTSESEALQQANIVREEILGGWSQAHAVRIEKWDATADRWALYETVHPKEQQ
jgi:hypothetical protein